MKAILNGIKLLVFAVLGFIGLMAIFGLLTSIGGDGEKPPEPVPEVAQWDRHPKQAQADPVVSPEPPKPIKYEPKPHYSYQDGYSYGYQVEGQPTLLMIQYLGEKDGLHMVVNHDGQVHTTFECRKPCDFVTMHSFFEAEHVKKEVLKTAPGMVILSIMQDAISGQLERYKDSEGRTMWVTEDGPHIEKAKANH